MNNARPEVIEEAPRARRVPRGEKRREEIAAVAQRVFLELGFSETTMQIIAASAGASKETLYRHFGSKEELFAEIVRTRAASVFSGTSDAHMRGEPEEVLTRIGHNFLHLLSGEQSLCLYRLVIAEIQRAPELGRIFLEQGPRRVLKELTAQIAEAVDANQLTCPDPELAARLFLGALVGHRHVEALIESFTMSEAQIDRHVGEAVAMFLARFGVATKDAKSAV